MPGKYLAIQYFAFIRACGQHKLPNSQLCIVSNFTYGYIFTTESITCFILYLVKNQTSTSVISLLCRCPMPTQTIIFPQSSIYPPTVLCLPIATCTCHKTQYCDGETLVSLKSQYGGGEKSDELLHNCNHQYQYGCLDMLKIENLCIILN